MGRTSEITYRRTPMLLAAAVLAGWVAGPLAGQPTPPSVEIGPGKLADPVVCAADPELSYALYLPSGYDPERTWPVVFLFDSEGRGAALAERFRTGADRYGFALVASDDAASDTPWEVNQRVVRILLGDAFRHVAIDSTRLHFAGFSGTARLAWSAGLGFRDAVTGVVLMGGATPGSELPKEAPPFPVFGITASEDFNHDEVVRLDTALGKLGTPHRLAVFEGGNEWPPEELATDALGWLYLQAIQTGRTKATPQTVSRLLDADLERVEALKQDGDLLAAADRAQEIVRDYGGLTTEDDPRLAGIRREADRLAGLREVKKARAEARRRQADAEIYRADLRRAILILRADRRPPQPNRLLTDLKIPLLQSRAHSDDPEEARAARRMLELAFVYTSYYLPPELMKLRLFRHAASSLTVATEIHPDRPEIWLDLARAFALAGAHKEALDALAHARDLGVGEEEIASDEALAPLTDEDAPKP